MLAHSSLADSCHVWTSSTSRGFRRGLKGLVVYDHFNLRRPLCSRDIILQQNPCFSREPG